MKTDVVKLVAAALVLVFAGAAEELLPKILGVGCPCLLMAAFWVSTRSTPLMSLLFAVAAGAIEDALCGLPAATGIGFFTLAAVAARVPLLTVSGPVLAYPLFQVWLWLWLPSLSGSIFSRLLLAVPVGALTALAMAGILAWLQRKAVLHVK